MKKHLTALPLAAMILPLAACATPELPAAPLAHRQPTLCT